MNTVASRKRDRVRAKAIPVLPIRLFAGPEIADVVKWLLQEKAKGVDITPTLQTIKGAGALS